VSDGRTKSVPITRDPAREVEYSLKILVGVTNVGLDQQFGSLDLNEEYFRKPSVLGYATGMAEEVSHVSIFYGEILDDREHETSRLKSKREKTENR
jgi:hypothetical protein